MAAETETRSARQAFASLAPRPLIAEHERLLQLRTALPALWLVPEQMRLYEGVGEPFELRKVFTPMIGYSSCRCSPPRPTSTFARS